MFTGKKLEISPVRDAYEEDTECPLCLLMEKAEKGYVGSFLGGAVMVPEARVEMNRTGFCPAHYTMLFHGGNKLGLALMVNTHLREHLPELLSRQEKLLKLSEASPGRRLRAKKRDAFTEELERYSERLRAFESSCLICERLETTLERYRFTIVYLWQKDRDFAETVRASKGFCLHHLPGLLATARGMLPRKETGAFVRDVLPLERKSLERLTSELEVFTEHFDYRRADEPWGNEKDSLPRTLLKLCGRIFGP